MNTVEQCGIVKSVVNRCVEVEITRSSLCGACESRGYCGAETSQQTVMVNDCDIHVLPGDAVTIIMEKSLGLKAVGFSYAMPLIIFMITVLTLFNMTKNEVLSGALAFAILIPYYFLLWFFRKTLKKSFVFRLRKT